ncbi:acyl-CoA synthetase [Mycobacterium eburneum]|nr:acyl-CoA synthetase [Mycobacterium eburneum]TDH52879.1 acyl-CoA synthetase [Mycobacterium eburneum]
MPTDDVRPDAAPRAKLDDDDHDLLTFAEAGERLRQEIADAERQVRELTAAGSEWDLAKATSRLQALQRAADRNRAAPINDANFEKFFGYPGTAKRNVPDVEAPERRR